MYLDLTQTLKDKMPVYPGDLAPELVSLAGLDQEGYNEYQLKTGMHVGTHIDAPWHLIENGKKISDFVPDKFFGAGKLVDARGLLVITADCLEKIKIVKGDIILILTGFSEKFGAAEYFDDYPEIDETFAEKIIELGVKMIGLDSPSPDRAPYNIHKLLLQKDILIIENLTNLEQLLGANQFEVFALPLKIAAEAGLARVIARK